MRQRRRRNLQASPRLQRDLAGPGGGKSCCGALAAGGCDRVLVLLRGGGGRWRRCLDGEEEGVVALSVEASAVSVTTVDKQAALTEGGEGALASGGPLAAAHAGVAATVTAGTVDAAADTDVHVGALLLQKTVA